MILKREVCSRHGVVNLWKQHSCGMAVENHNSPSRWAVSLNSRASRRWPCFGIKMRCGQTPTLHTIISGMILVKPEIRLSNIPLVKPQSEKRFQQPTRVANCHTTFPLHRLMEKAHGAELLKAAIL